MIIGSLGAGLFFGNDSPMPPSVPQDISWISPGRAAWSWYAEGDSCGDMNIQRQHVDFAAEMGWEYSVVDGGWEGKLDVPRLIAYAKQRGVGIWLWTHYKGLNTKELREEKLRCGHPGAPLASRSISSTATTRRHSRFMMPLPNPRQASADGQFPWIDQTKRRASDLASCDDKRRRLRCGILPGAE